MIDEKGSEEMDLYIIELIEKHMAKDHEYGKKVFKNVVNREKTFNNFGI